MISIPRAIYRIYRNNFKRHFLKKKKTFSAFLIAFLKSAWNLEYFLKTYECPSVLISGIVDSGRPGYLNVLKVLL